VKVLGVLLAAVPFAFASIRLLTTGSDMRYLWMAIVSAFCAAAVLVRTSSLTVPGPARTGVATIAATACTAAAAIMLGATAGPGIVIVAVAFGLCSALGTALLVRSRIQQAK
jgi:hypothetical protein